MTQCGFDWYRYRESNDTVVLSRYFCAGVELIHDYLGTQLKAKAVCSRATVLENDGVAARILVRAKSSEVICVPDTAFLDSLKSHINLRPAARTRVTASSRSEAVTKERDRAASGEMGDSRRRWAWESKVLAASLLLSQWKKACKVSS